jgi:hypothetical protein
MRAVVERPSKTAVELIAAQTADTAGGTADASEALGPSSEHACVLHTQADDLAPTASARRRLVR